MERQGEVCEVRSSAENLAGGEGPGLLEEVGKEPGGGGRTKSGAGQGQVQAERTERNREWLQAAPKRYESTKVDMMATANVK